MVEVSKKGKIKEIKGYGASFTSLCGCRGGYKGGVPWLFYGEIDNLDGESQVRW